MDPVLAGLLAKLAHKPELLNPSYLKYYLGPPDQVVNNSVDQSSVYYWYDELRNPKVQLHTERDVSIAREADVMLVHLPESDLNLQAVGSALGHNGKRLFDHNGHPAAMYSFAPNTSISFISPQNSFAVRKVAVIYKGGLLPPPSAEDLQCARDHHVVKLSKLTASGQWRHALTVARERVKEEPSSAEAHVALAQALSKSGHLHAAVSEYKYAMSLSPANDELRKSCTKELERMNAHAREDNSKAPM